jgi:hypothetical protein
MSYPRYIVQWSEGRLPCPPQFKGTSVRRLFESGKIGGSRNVERETSDPEEAKRLWSEDRFNRRVYVIKKRGRQRELVQKPHELINQLKQSEGRP